MELHSYNYREKSESQKYIETLCNEYIANHVREQERDELIHENNIEKRDIKGYHGREILELMHIRKVLMKEMYQAVNWKY